MKKYIVLALLFVPMVAWGAPSVRVLGNKAATPAATTTVTKVTPAKTTAVTTGDTTSRVGTVRAKAKTSAVSNTAANSVSRFPVITPAKSYNAVIKPQPSGGNTTVKPVDVDTDAIVQEVTQNVEQNIDNYKQEVNTIINELKDKDDPRFDMVRVSTENPVNKWSGYDIPSDYVFMWVED